MTAQTDPWLLLCSGRGGSAYNMAFDEALLENAGRISNAMLRFYSWAEPAATFGYFQRYAEVQKWTLLRPLIRRPTGGGVVPHDADWTYSVIVPRGHAWEALRAAESYRRLHEWLQAAFAAFGVEASLAPVRREEAPGRCFAGAERDDLILAGGKIAGAAQRRNRQGLLIQGSVQAPTGIARPDWEAALINIAKERWGVFWTAWEPDSAVLAHAQSLAEEKYSQAWYNQRR